MKNITDTIINDCSKYLHKVALIEKGRKVTYRELFDSVSMLSSELNKRGITRFKRVALLCEDGIDYIIISLAVLKLYAVIIPVPFGASREEIRGLMERMKVNFFIFENKSLADLRLDKSIKTGALGKKIFCQSIESEDNLPDLFFRINPAFIRFSSGTTGASKGVVLSHETILERTAAANRAMRITHKDKIIWVLSMSFHFVVTILLFLRKGATIILSSQDFPENLLANLKKYKATVIYASPVHYNLLSSLSSCKKIFLSKVRLAISTAVSLPEAIAEKFAGKFGFELSEAYGIIEVGLPALNSSGDKSKRGSVGKASLSFKIKVADKYSNGIGRILITGRGMLDAYFSPWRMRREILTRGWFDTGDLGRIDKDGYLFIVGRGKNVINFNGMKIFPSEVEEVLIRHPQIKEVLVYGVSHPQYGQLPVAKIVLNDQKQSKISIEDLRVFAYRYLSVYKVPKEFHVVSVLPKTASGKVEIS